jgi:hypothetical protein
MQLRQGAKGNLKCPTHLAWRNGAEFGGQQNLAVAHSDAGQLPIGELDVVLLLEVVCHRHLLARSLVQELLLHPRQGRQAGGCPSAGLQPKAAI